jgi:hypothetical protein
MRMVPVPGIRIHCDVIDILHQIVIWMTIICILLSIIAKDHIRS